MFGRAVLGYLAAVVLAAGQGSRMKSQLPKVLHPVAGRPMARYVLEAVAPLVKRTVVVVGYGGQRVRDALDGEVEFVEQAEPLGTGHAVLQARPLLDGQAERVLVLCGDTPLLETNTLTALAELQHRTGAAIALLTAIVEEPAGYGRILRDQQGRVRRVIEEKLATREERAIKEVNRGVYCFKADWLWSHLALLRPNQDGEYYVTDLVSIAAWEDATIEALTGEDPSESMGINDRSQLAEAESIMRWRIRRRLMMSGVTLMDPLSTFIDATVEIGEDTTIYPNCLIEGRTLIGTQCTIGPNSQIVNSTIGRGCRIISSMVEDSTVEDDVVVGPFSHLRASSYVETGAYIGNFAEVKKTRIGSGTRMHHFGYLGDATVGRDANIGAGTVTCNYDAETRTKHASVIGDEAAIGSDTLLVAPVRVGPRALTGAGSVVTKDVPPDTVVVGVPARPVRRRRDFAQAPEGKG